MVSITKSLSAETGIAPRQPRPLQRKDRAMTWHAVVTADLQGRILTQNHTAQRLILTYFEEEASDDSLPARVMRFADNERARLLSLRGAAAPNHSLRVEHDGQVLEVAIAIQSDGYVLTLREESDTPGNHQTRTLGLSKREAEVLHFVALGKTNWEIAIILGISRLTVGKHMEHILERLGVETRTAAAAVAIEARNAT